MDPSILRSKLCYAIEELQNLTTQDLIDCKWPVLQRIFILIIAKTPILNGINEKILDLMELRNIELHTRRISNENKNDSKIKWNEQNATFKTGFYRIIIEGLTLLRWPPGSK